MRIGLLTLDQRGKVALFNTAAEQMLGYRAQEARGTPCEEILTGLTDLRSRLIRMRSSKKQEAQLNAEARCKDGRTIRLVITLHPPLAAGKGAIIVFQDARELEKMENQLEHLDRLRSLDEFAAGIVHEIRNPLAGISTNAQYMMEKIDPSGPFHEEVRDILADVSAIEDIVSAVLDFAHPSKPQVRETLIEDIVAEVLRFSRMPLRRQGIRLLTDLGKHPARVRVDVSQMKQVFFNIVRDAREAMPEGGELHVSTTQLPVGNGHIRVEVEDTGRGIAEQYLS